MTLIGIIQVDAGISTVKNIRRLIHRGYSLEQLDQTLSRLIDLLEARRVEESHG